jgi:voltage-gated potassium channel
MVLLVVICGTFGYWVLWSSEGGTFLDALYMTVMTITTVGFQEVRPLDSTGRILTMAVAIGGIGSLFYVFGVLMDYVASPELQNIRRRRRMQAQISELKDHVIVAGLGRVGQEAAKELRAAKVPFVVIDPAERARRYAEAQGYLFVDGDSTADSVLHAAGITRARGLVVTTDSDATNTYVVLSARLLNPRLQIVTRSAEPQSLAKLLRAGANHAINPHAIGGRRLAHMILSPTVVDFFETILTRGDARLSIEDIALTEDTPWVGKALGSLRIAEETGATTLALVRPSATLVAPPADILLCPGDHLLILGTGKQLEYLDKLLDNARTNA